MKKLFNLAMLPYGMRTWAEWLESRVRRHQHTFRDDIIDICVKLIKEIYYLHNITAIQFQYTPDTLHIEICFGNDNYYGLIPFTDITSACTEEEVENEKESIKEKLKTLLLDAFGRR